MISVVICAYSLERWTQIQAAVSSVEHQAPVAHEIVLVIDHNDELLERCREQWPETTVVPNGYGQGLSGARNTGIEASRGEIIAFLDDDAVAAAAWLQAIADAFVDGVAGIGGRVVPAWEEPPPGWFPPEFWWVVGCSYTGQSDAYERIRNPIGANMAFRASVFAEVGGFREGIGRVGKLPLGCEETELSIRAARAGHRVWNQPAALVDHLVPPSRTTRRYFLRRCYAEGISKAIVASLAGHGDSLASERRYVLRALPVALGRGLRRAVTGPQRRAALGQVSAIIGGVGAAVAGYVRGATARRTIGNEPAPVLIIGGVPESSSKHV